MKLEQQVCSLELAKKLAELGVKQESLFWWNPGVTNNKVWYELRADPCNYGSPTKLPKGITHLSAFTVAELGEMLPKYISYSKGRNFYYCKDIKHKDCYSALTEANARAKMLIYLIENKLIIL